MIIFNFLKTFVSEVVSWVKANSVSTACLIGLPVVTINMLNNVDKKSTRLKSIDDKYRSKRYPEIIEKPAEKLTYERIYHKGMNVVAFVYDKNTDTIKERLNTTKSIKEMAELYMIHPTIVSNCAVYNALVEQYGTDYAEAHIRIVRKYVTPGTISSLSDADKNAVMAYTNSVTFKYE